MKWSILILFILIAFSTVSSQEITNIHFEQKGKKINIYYDLSGEGTYEIKAYCSQDGGNSWGSALNNVTGSIGIDQLAGQGKIITWDVLTEHEKLVGNVAFKVEALTLQLNGNSGTFTDLRDGKNYKWVKIGDQIWMAENLNYSKVAWSRCYEENKSNCEIYGRLYDWKSAKTACPTGWHLPSDEDWMKLIIFLGGESVAGGNVKETGASHWRFPNVKATNTSGFTALPGGMMDMDGIFYGLGTEAHFWSSYKNKAETAVEFQISQSDGEFRYSFQNVFHYLTVRCLKD